jgi:hypothetical protein
VTAVAQDAAREQMSFAEFLERLLGQDRTFQKKTATGLAPPCSYKQSECCERQQESGRLRNRVDGRVAWYVGLVRWSAWSPTASAIWRSVALARKVAGRTLAISRRGGGRNEEKKRG